MGWGRISHQISHGVGKAAGYIAKAATGSKSAQREAEKAVGKAVRYNPIGTTGNIAYQTLHGAEHLLGDPNGSKNANVADAGVEMPDYSEYLAAMGEYIAAMNEAMNREEPAQEPLKQAQVEMSAARADTNRKQLLRRGLMSTYTRYASQGGTQRLGA